MIEESTVKTHVKRILMKLRLRDRVQAVIFAYESGLTPRRIRVRPAGARRSIERARGVCPRALQRQVLDRLAGSSQGCYGCRR